jgi:hypothetical protein
MARTLPLNLMKEKAETIIAEARTTNRNRLPDSSPEESEQKNKQ